MHSYSLRFYHLDGYLTHRVTHGAADLGEALAWAGETFTDESGMLDVLEGETVVWRGTPQQVREYLDTRDAA